MSTANPPQNRARLSLALDRRILAAVPATAAAALLIAVPGASARHRGHKHHAYVSGRCAGQYTPASRGSFAVLRGAVLCLINQQRRSRGLPRLHLSGRLNRSAQGWTNTMIRYGIFSHGANFAARISATGFNWSQAGENIATGFATPHAVVSAWMHSTDHCHNILDPDYRYIGIGVDASAVRGWGSGGATWTQDFALPMGQRAPSGNWGPSNGCPY